jgi:hypothetical protein
MDKAEDGKSYNGVVAKRVNCVKNVQMLRVEKHSSKVGAIVL